MKTNTRPRMNGSEIEMTTDVDRLLAQAPAPSSRRRDALLGLLVALAVLSAVATLLVFTDAGMFRGRSEVAVVVDDAGGLRRGDPVQMRGVNIGRVRGFTFTPDGVRVRAEINGEYRPPDNSRVVLRSDGLLGGMIVEFVPGDSPRVLGRGAEVTGTSEGPLTRAAAEVGENAAGVLRRAEDLLAEPTVSSLRRGATSLDELLMTLAGVADRERHTVEAVGTDLRHIAAGLRDASDAGDLPGMVTRTDTLLARLERSAASVEGAAASLDRVLGLAAGGEGTAALLAGDPRLYEELVRATASVARLADDVRENPKKYVTVRIF
jgi:phospholipid/cholesterol/gamma-HCH transport system substrate-binding protein